MLVLYAALGVVVVLVLLKLYFFKSGTATPEIKTAKLDLKKKINDGKEVKKEVVKKKEEVIPQSVNLVESPYCVAKFIAHTGKCYGACWLNNTYIVTIGKDRSMMLHELESIREKNRKNFRINLDCGVDIPVKINGARDGRFIVITYKSNKSIAYQILPKKIDGKRTKQLAEYAKPESEIVSLTVSKQLILTCMKDTCVTVSSFKGEELGSLKPKLLRLNMADIDTNENIIAIASAMNDIRLYRTIRQTAPKGMQVSNSSVTGIEPSHFSQLNGHTASISSVCFTKDSKHLVSASQDRSWKIWSIEGDDKRGFVPFSVFSAINPNTNNDVKYEKLVLSHDNKYLLIGCTLGLVQLWSFDNENSLFLNSYNGNDTSEITNISWAPDNSQFCVSYIDGFLRVFTIPTKF